jgi:hypothetical protein
VYEEDDENDDGYDELAKLLGNLSVSGEHDAQKSVLM